jgi:fumarate reductase subunit D
MKTNVLRPIATVCVVLATALLPLSVRAQSGDKDTAQGFIVLITHFIGDVLLPFLFALALLFFLVNVARYFVIGGDDAESQEKAKTLAIYGIGAFVFLISIWGIVNMFVNAFEIDDDEAKCPDYLQDWCGSSGNYGSSASNEYFQNYNPSTQYQRNVPVNSEVFSTNPTPANTELIREPVTPPAELQREPVNTPPSELIREPVTPTETESAPVNIGDTLQKPGSCTTNANGVETCNI